MKRIIFFIILLTIILISTIAIYKHFYHTAAPAAPKPPMVFLVPVELKTIPLTLKALGQVVAPQTIMLKTQTAGIVTQIYFKSGQQVKKGQILLQLDPTSAKANLEQYYANYINLKTQYDRFNQLSKNDPGVVAADTLSQKQSTMEAAKAQYQAAQQELDYTQIRAPFDGIIGVPEQILNQVNIANTSLNEPMQLNIGSYLPAGSAIALLSNPNNSYVQYQVAQNDEPLLKVGQSVKIHLAAFPKQLFTGVVKYISPVVYQSNQAVEVMATIDNPNPQIRSGMSVNIIQTTNPDQKILAVPGLSLVPSLTGYSVYTVVDGKVKEIPVSIGQRFDDSVAILSGLKEGDQIISNGALNVHPGVAVQIKTPKTS